MQQLRADTPAVNASLSRRPKGKRAAKLQALSEFQSQWNAVTLGLLVLLAVIAVANQDSIHLAKC